MYISAKPAPLVRFTTGSFASSGSTPFTSLTLDRTSASARSALASRRSLSVMIETFCEDRDSMMSTPSVDATACCSGVVMKPLIWSALAPG